MAGKKPQRNFREEAFTLVFCLHQVHDQITKTGEITPELRKNTQKAVFKISEWELKDPETQKLVEDLKHIAIDQLTLSRRTKAKKEELWKQYVSNSKNQTLINDISAGIP